MSSFIGIDLGTTFSAVATLDKTGRPVIIDNPDEQKSPVKNITSSCVRLNRGKLSAGHEARIRYQTGKKDSIGRFKSSMGSKEKFKLNDEEFNATELSAAVLKEMKIIAESHDKGIVEAVITVPANFSHDARSATMEAAKLAGLNVNHIIDEPTAAALYYAFKSDESVNGNFAVFDLGGGTFDVSIIKISDGKDVEVIASNGLHKLGGDDFDKALINIVEKKFNEKFDKKFESEKHYTLNDAEGDKIILSNVEKTIASQNAIEGEIFNITRKEFEEEISTLIAQIELLCESVLNEANLKNNDIDGVFLAGGSTRIPSVTNSVEKIFNQKPIQTENVDEIVALGASLYSAFKGDSEHLTAAQEASISKLDVQDVTSDYFGTIAIRVNDNTNSEERFVDVLIPKNEKRPCKVSREYFTRFEGQERLNCTVTQSKTPDDDPNFVKTIWQGDLELPPGRPAGQQINVKFSYDENSIIHCEFEDDETKQITEVDIDAKSTSEEESEIDKFLVD